MTARVSHAGHTFDPVVSEEHVPGRFVTGILPGLYAGAIMAFCICILTAARGVPLTEPIRLVASVMIGAGAMTGGAIVVVLGVGIHFVVSMFLGSLFTRIFGPTTMRRLLGFGLFYGIFLWAIAQFLLMPLANPEAATQLGTMWPFFVGHLAFGVTLASAVPTVHDIDAPPSPEVAERELREQRRQQ